MRYSNQGRFRQQVSFLRRQFLQDGDLPFSNVLSQESIAQALAAIGVCWLDRVYPPLVTLWIFLGQVLSADHSCRAAVARLIAHRISQGKRPCSSETSAYCQARKRLYDDHIRNYYVKDGELTSEVNCIKCALRPLVRLFSKTLVSELSPRKLTKVRQSMIDAGRERKSINRNVGRITRMFRWAVAQEFCPSQIFTALESVDGLRSGRNNAIETEDVKPVLLEHVDAVSAFVTRPVLGLIRFQLATACRPGEAIITRGCDITMMGDVWKYLPASHKTEHHGKGRTILVGPQGQAVVREFLNTDLQAYLFNPQAADPRRANAKTHRPGERYRRDSYTTAIRRACVKAGVPTWTPNQLRHTAATAIRAVADLDTARAVLGHSSLTTAEIYAERDIAAAHEVMRKIG